MREKLIELLCKAHGMATDASLFEDASFAQQLETEADHLIANGVTIQKWIPVTERLPEEDTRVLVWLRVKIYDHTHMDTDRLHRNRWVRWGEDVTHWMPLPEPPNGERRNDGN